MIAEDLGRHQKTSDQVRGGWKLWMVSGKKNRAYAGRGVGVRVLILSSFPGALTTADIF